MRRGELDGRDGGAASILDSHSPFFYKGTLYETTIRSAGCSLLVPKKLRCPSCQLQRQLLNKQVNRTVKRCASSSGLKSKFGPNSSLETPERVKKLLELAKKRKNDQRCIQRLTLTMANSVDSCGVVVSDRLHDNLVDITDKNVRH